VGGSDLFTDTHQSMTHSRALWATRDLAVLTYNGIADALQTEE
jgi:hypothetical protein